MAVRGGWRPLSGFVKLLIQLVREILHLSGKSQGISNTYGCGNHVNTKEAQDTLKMPR